MRLFRGVAFLILLFLLSAGYGFYRLARPYQGFTQPVFVDLPHGTSSGAIADLLVKAGVLRNRWDFLLARVVRRGHILQAGEYKFDRPESPLEVFNRIARGDIFYYSLVVPEGKNMFDIAALVEPLGLFTGEAFLSAAHDPSSIRDLDPKATTLEGYLFPNTYKLNRHSTPEGLCKMMTAKFREVWRDLKTDGEIHDTVTLASLVEREGKVADERPLIAAVFSNRLRLGMKLDCDPTTIYAALLDKRYHGVIHRSDLDSQSLYNTYRHAGLPPGPIANPGRASLDAALHPAQSDALYFVLRPDGSDRHEFTNNIADHNAAVGRYHHSQK